MILPISNCMKSTPLIRVVMNCIPSRVTSTSVASRLRSTGSIRLVTQRHGLLRSSVIWQQDDLARSGRPDRGRRAGSWRHCARRQHVCLALPRQWIQGRLEQDTAGPDDACQAVCIKRCRHRAITAQLVHTGIPPLRLSVRFTLSSALPWILLVPDVPQRLAAKSCLTGAHHEQKSGSEEIHKKRTCQDAKGKKGRQEGQESREVAPAIRFSIENVRFNMQACMSCKGNRYGSVPVERFWAARETK